jgi:hypothetical protein
MFGFLKPITGRMGQDAVRRAIRPQQGVTHRNRSLKRKHERNTLRC